MGMMGQKFPELVNIEDFCEDARKSDKVQSMAALQGTIVTIGNALAVKIPPKKAPIITVQINPTVIVQTYLQQPADATQGEEYHEYKTVLWTYQQKRKAKKTDSATAHAMTRSGRCYAPEEVNRGNSGREQIPRRNITDLEAAEFWKTMSSKEYSVEEQLKKTLAQISIMDLQMSSNNHKNTLLKVLSGVSVPSNTTSEALAVTIEKMVEANMITFKRDELPVEGASHNKTLHITVKHRDKVASRVLVDGGSGVNICPLSTMRELGIHLRELKESHVRLRAFDGSQKDVIGEIYLALHIGPIDFLVLFQVMEISSSYNLLLGRRWKHMVGVVPSTLHQCIKFEWGCQEIVVHGEWGHSAYLEYDVPFIEGLDGVAFHAVEIMQTTKEEKTEQNLGMQSSYRSKMAVREMMKDCYRQGTRLGAKSDRIIEPIEHNGQKGRAGIGYQPPEGKTCTVSSGKKEIEQLESQKKPNLEETKVVNLRNKEDVKETRISIHLEANQKEKMIELLRQYVDMFAWSYDDMPGLSTDIISHRLPTNPTRPSVKQKLRKFKPGLSQRIKKEVTKQIEANIVRISNYPSWLENIVPVPKKDGKIRICVDYRDLNKSSTKEDFPLLNIHIRIDNCVKHELQSFMDCFAGYHQILMHKEDAKKIALTTP
ncbi:uncharacterized protein LOC107803507 [Nicotiana tabacum]|uniref:Uncharacterized protein LOC107803507 n=1 Tax=Nicotiana tabacum TaxID=4097 RepID=A0AC58RWL6_TOBAC